MSKMTLRQKRAFKKLLKSKDIVLTGTMDTISDAGLDELLAWLFILRMRDIRVVLNNENKLISLFYRKFNENPDKCGFKILKYPSIPMNYIIFAGYVDDRMQCAVIKLV